MLPVTMSFDLFLVAFQNGDKGLGDAAAARAVLDRVRHEHRPEFDAYSIEFDDGSHLEMYAGGLKGGGGGGDKPFDGGMIVLRGLSDAIAGFVFEFSRAGGCVVIPAMDPPCVLIPRDDLASHLPADFDFNRIPVAGGGEVLAALRGGHEAWRAYRDHVLRAAHEGKPPPA